MFADISGFTAWSSVREPSQVFTLLECIYNSFDVLARKSKVFKVETIGDCYVAVCGLPNPRKDHALVMARYAYACLGGMRELTNKLEVTLGYVFICIDTIALISILSPIAAPTPAVFF